MEDDSAEVPLPDVDFDRLATDEICQMYEPQTSDNLVVPAGVEEEHHIRDVLQKQQLSADEAQWLLHRREYLISHGFIHEVQRIEPRFGPNEEVIVPQFMYLLQGRKYRSSTPHFKDGGSASGTLYRGDSSKYPNEGMLRTTASPLKRLASVQMYDNISVILWSRVRWLRQNESANAIRSPSKGRDFEHIEDPRWTLAVISSKSNRRTCPSPMAGGSSSGQISQIDGDTARRLNLQITSIETRLDLIEETLKNLQEQICALSHRSDAPVRPDDGSNALEKLAEVAGCET